MTEIVVKKHRGQSAEHMAKIRAMRKEKGIEVLPDVFPKSLQAPAIAQSALNTQYAFAINAVEAVGGTLYELEMLTLAGDTVASRMLLTHADSKAATLNQLRMKCHFLTFEERMPEKRSEGVPDVQPAA